MRASWTLLNVPDYIPIPPLWAISTLMKWPTFDQNVKWFLGEEEGGWGGWWNLLKHQSWQPAPNWDSNVVLLCSNTETLSSQSWQVEMSFDPVGKTRWPAIPLIQSHHFVCRNYWLDHKDEVHASDAVRCGAVRCCARA